MTASQWLEVLMSYSVQVVIVTVACAVLERTLLQSADRCTLWSMCFFSVLLLGCAALLLPRLHLIQPWSRLHPRTLLSITAAQSIIGKSLVAIWCIGASVATLQWILRGHLLRRTLRRCELMSDREAQKHFGSMLPDAPGYKLPHLLISDEIDGPFCWQLHEPTVVLPRFLLEGSQDDLQNVFRHELEHLRTNHPLQLFFQNLAQVVCWFHPAVWRAGARASLLREFTCDEAAAASGSNTAGYLRTLLRIAERHEKKQNKSAMSFVRQPSEIVLRARRLVNLANESQLPARWMLGKKTAMSVLLVLTLIAYLVSIPCDSLASSRSFWSPWPTWTAQSIHCFGITLRDYEKYDPRSQVFEIALDANASVGSREAHRAAAPASSNR